jgi:hypothetical protein
MLKNVKKYDSKPESHKEAINSQQGEYLRKKAKTRKAFSKNTDSESESIADNPISNNCEKTKTGTTHGCVPRQKGAADCVKTLLSLRAKRSNL